MTRESLYPKLVLFGGVATLFLVWITIALGLYLTGEDREKQNIVKKLPEGAFLRDMVKIGGEKNEGWLVVYVEKGYVVESTTPESMLSCPGEIVGEPIRGIYHLELFQNGKVVNDVVIPDDRENVPGYQLALVYRNIKGNIYRDLNRQDKSDVENVRLLSLKDYTGDGKALEFLLMTTEGGCGFWDGLVAGYDPAANRAVIYSDWVPRFSPDNKGNYHYLFECGDHGNNVRLEEDYVFDKKLNRFMKVFEKETPCEA